MKHQFTARVLSVLSILSMLLSAVGMPMGIAHADSTGLVCESFEALTTGAMIGTKAGWYDGGGGPVVTAGNGVAGSKGLGTANNIFNWTAHPFNWNTADFQKINLQGDFQSNASGQFDDDRLSWT